MASEALAQEPPVSAQTPHPYRWTVAEFHTLVKCGIFKKEQRIELIEGVLIEMAPIGSDHTSNVKRFNHRLTVLLSDRAIVSVQDPITLDDYSEPQPDIALLRWRDDFYRSANPRTADVLLIIEAANSSLQFDRERKIPLYARHDIPEVWLFDLKQQRLEAYRKPVAGEYTEITYHRGGMLAPCMLPDTAIDLAEFFWAELK